MCLPGARICSQHFRQRKIVTDGPPIVLHSCGLGEHSCSSAASQGTALKVEFDAHLVESKSSAFAQAAKAKAPGVRQRCSRAVLKPISLRRQAALLATRASHHGVHLYRAPYEFATRPLTYR